MADSRTLIARAYPYLAVLPFATTAVVPDTINPGVVSTGGLLLGGAMCAAGALTIDSPVRRRSAIAAGAVVAVALWFGLASAWALNPKVSLFGLVGQNNGAAVWILAAVWIVAGLVCADAKAVRHTLAAVAGAGVFFASASVYEAVADGAQRAQGYAAGFFDNSTSSGELFAVTLFAALTGAVISRSRNAKIAYAAAGAASATGLLLSSSRTGMLGVAAAVLFAAAIVWLPAERPRTWLLGIAPTAVVSLLTVFLLGAASGLMGGGVQHAVSAVGTERDVIWRAALAQLMQAPILGSGLEQFSAWMNWSVGAGQLNTSGTADPHNVFLAAALGGGVIGLVLLLAAFAALSVEGVRIAREARRSWGVALVVSTPVVLLGAGLVGWIAPAALLAAGAITGAALGAANPRPETKKRAAVLSPRFARSSALAVGIAGLAVGLAFVPVARVEYVYVTSLMPGAQPLVPTEAEQLYTRFPDPGILALALASLTPAVQAGDQGVTDQALTLLTLAERDQSWSAPLAQRALVVAQALEANDQAAFPRFERIMRAGIHADPASGMWYSFAALEAERLGLAEQSRSYAASALLYPLDPTSLEAISPLAGR